MTIPIEYVNRKREIEATDASVIVRFFIKLDQSWAEARENVAVVLATSKDSRIPQVGDSLGEGMKVGSRRFNQVVDRVDLYDLECDCPFAMDDESYNPNTDWGNKRIVAIDYDVVEYSVAATHGIFWGSNVFKTGSSRGEYSNADLPLFKFGHDVPIQSSSAEPFDDPLMTTQYNQLIRLTQKEGRLSANNDDIRRLMSHLGSLNSEDIQIAGVQIPAREGLMRGIKPIPQPGGELQVAYEIEVVIDRPHYREILDQGYKFLQTSSNPQSQRDIKRKYVDPSISGDAGEEVTTIPAKLNGAGKVYTATTDSDALGGYLLFFTHTRFINWNSSLDLINRVR